ncbi:MAG: protein-L-isoaspartate(D-aspartate) O-methyltransferase [Elusimicrobia bacterium]|nr:protein-L-isoaspartate(D-aspartate) O-methyltransferase [Elusimicrobiota bacterium]
MSYLWPAAFIAAALVALGCRRGAPPPQEDYALMRDAMVNQIEAYPAEQRVRDPRVLAVMRKVPRHEFVPENARHLAYADTPLDIGAGQTISQPYMVAFMTQALELKPEDKVLEIGTGSGYQAAILAELTGAVYSIEIVESLARRAQDTLTRLGYGRVHTRTGDGYQGWPEQAPFDAIVVTCAPERVPQPLVAQLREGGRLVIPLGPEASGVQELLVLRKTAAGLREETRMPVRFVPMTGAARR